MSRYMNEDELLSLIKKMNLASELQAEPLAAGLASPGTQSKVKVENNKIILLDGTAEAEFASLEAVYPVQLLRNGKVLHERTFLEPGDHIDWQVDEQPLFRMEVTADKQEAYLQIRAKQRYGWRLKEQEARAHLIVEAEEDPNVVLESVSFAEIMKQLQSKGIVKNLRTSAIFQELQQPSGERILVAQGVPPEPSEDARLELYFSEEVTSELKENEMTKTIDFRNHLQIPSVKKGDLIARKFPAKSGVTGYDVYGELIHPATPKDITLIAKDNVEITGDGEVYAQKEGRPRIMGNASIKYFDISTSYVISGDIDLKTGNIVFSGDVIVYGNVTEGMIIESLGNVYIFGNVFQATITATGSITVKGNIIKSNLYSGYFGVIFNRLYVSCKALSEQLVMLVQAARQLSQMIDSRGQTVPLGQVLLVLMESKFKDIPRLSSEALDTIRSLQRISAKELEDLKEKVLILQNSHAIVAFDSYNPIYSIQNLVEETYLMVERMQEVTANIDVDQAHLANLKSTGDILIRKEGVLQSQLFCKGNIIFFDRNSVCRGGQLEAHGTISAMLVGGDYGSETILKAGKRIMLQRMNSGRICVGKYWKEILTPIVHMTAYLQDRGLVVEGQQG
ncbi:DUF342 domain-containing protein [Paenibacillus athensensis]|uniref:Flagellar Assembly Protein A N-terminal region domain-containing protein n=1 Tax=Paenibacillus athensensis TaxID=1967502 RepID=A0A4Y8Q2E6_9BACL|nr:FapA family protein [Paenibacillus athensensis]MCD1258684.1 DUF342 domain-containing protein [Paenibacillus athensensis]